MPTDFDPSAYVYHGPPLGTGAAMQLAAMQHLQATLENQGALAHQAVVEGQQDRQLDQGQQQLNDINARDAAGIQANKDMQESGHDFQREAARKGVAQRITQALYSGDKGQLQALAPEARMHGLDVHVEDSGGQDGTAGGAELRQAAGMHALPGMMPGLSLGQAPVAPRPRVVVRDQEGNVYGDADLDEIQRSNSQGVEQHFAGQIEHGLDRDKYARQLGQAAAMNMPGTRAERIVYGNELANQEMNRQHGDLRAELNGMFALDRTHAAGDEAARIAGIKAANDAAKGPDDKHYLDYRTKILSEMDKFGDVAKDAALSKQLDQNARDLVSGNFRQEIAAVLGVAKAMMLGDRMTDADFRIASEDRDWLSQAGNLTEEKIKGHFSGSKLRGFMQAVLSYKQALNARMRAGYGRLTQERQGARTPNQRAAADDVARFLYGDQKWYGEAENANGFADQQPAAPAAPAARDGWTPNPAQYQRQSASTPAIPATPGSPPPGDNLGTAPVAPPVDKLSRYRAKAEQTRTQRGQ